MSRPIVLVMTIVIILLTTKLFCYYLLHGFFVGFFCLLVQCYCIFVQNEIILSYRI